MKNVPWSDDQDDLQVKFGLINSGKMKGITGKENRFSCFTVKLPLRKKRFIFVV